jgi:CheY-like chemotaxis protein
LQSASRRADVTAQPEGITMNILLVEDSAGDVRLTREVFNDVNPSIRLHVVPDGSESIAFLKRRGRHALAPRPAIIILDLNMPKMDGREVMALVKADENLKQIPIVVLTTSTAEGDIVQSYELQANCYLVKPVELDRFEDLVKSINEYWITKVRLPAQSVAA